MVSKVLRVFGAVIFIMAGYFMWQQRSNTAVYTDFALERKQMPDFTNDYRITALKTDGARTVLIESVVQNPPLNAVRPFPELRKVGEVSGKMIFATTLGKDLYVPDYYLFDANKRTITSLKTVNDGVTYKPKESPDGLHVVDINSDENILFLFDLINDSSRELAVLGAGETFAQDYKGMACLGTIPITWMDQTTLKYNVYKAGTASQKTCEGENEFLRTVTVKI